MGRKLSDLGEAWTNLRELAEDELIEKEQIIAALDEIKGDMQTKIRSINILRRRFYSKADHYKRRGDNLTEYLLGVLIHRLGD